MCCLLRDAHTFLCCSFIFICVICRMRCHVRVLDAPLLPSACCQTGGRGKSVWETEIIHPHLHSPLDRGGNGNTPCARPVKRQFPWDTPPLSTALCYAFIIGHTHSHTQSHFQQIHTVIKLRSWDFLLNCPWARHSLPNCCRSNSLPGQSCIHVYTQTSRYNCMCPCIHTVTVSVCGSRCVYCPRPLL